jgi:hypothetical protein
MRSCEVTFLYSALLPIGTVKLVASKIDITAPYLTPCFGRGKQICRSDNHNDQPRTMVVGQLRSAMPALLTQTSPKTNVALLAPTAIILRSWHPSQLSVLYLSITGFEVQVQVLFAASLSPASTYLNEGCNKIPQSDIISHRRRKVLWVTGDFSVTLKVFHSLGSRAF